MKSQTIAVDFDGTLCEDAWPDIGDANEWLIEFLKQQQKDGHKLILWTCREGVSLHEATTWCADYGLYFDAINDNLPELKAAFGNNPRKIGADVYIDDKSLAPFWTRQYRIARRDYR